MKKLLLLAVPLLIIGAFLRAQGQTPAGWGDAMWIWDEADAQKVPQNNEPRYLRLTFDLSAKPQAAELWVTVDNLYTAHVNGQKVGEDKEWATVEKYDVAKHLVVGKNVIAIKAVNQGGVAGAIARLHVKTADKKDLFVVTNEKTKIWRAEPRKGPVEWTKADFDDSSWFNAVVLGDPSIGPWNLAGNAVAQIPGKGPKAYGSNTVDPSIKTRLSAKDQLKYFIVPKDFEIELVAADPIVINPITMVLDDKGRIIVSESHTYRYGPAGSPIKPYANPVIRLDPDGKGGFTRTLIADGFADPVMGIAVKGDKLWLTANNYLYTYDLPKDAVKPIGKDAFLPSPLRARGTGGEGAETPESATHFGKLERDAFVARTSPSPPSLLPLSTGGEGGRSANLQKGDEPKQKPIATNKKTIVTDLNKAWNPFGMFVLEWGPDGKLYMSVGNHNINLQGPNKETMNSRGSSGMIVRMNPDGTKMERLVHGLRVPYSFEFDPFGQLWLLSNGEGNPNRFVRVIEGVDYHCYSRNVDNNWLAGNHPLAPPCEEVHDGAHTQFMRYYAANFPAAYQGNLFACNWGRHGFAGANRGIYRFVLDERNNIVKKETLVTCADPHFRPAHIHLDVDGSLLIADWYGRDDESDMTGRIWRLKYVGKDRPVVKHKLDSEEWKNDDYAIEGLGSPSHLVREKAMEHLVNQDRGAVIAKLITHASIANESLGAANALWTLVRIGKLPPDCFEAPSHPDWRVRRLQLEITRRRKGTAGARENEKDLAVLIEAAMVKASHFDVDGGMAFVDAIKRGAMDDPHLCYQAAWHLAKNAATPKAFAELLNSDEANVRLAGLIAIDIACFEYFPSKKPALESLAKALENPGKLDHQLLLTVAQMNGDASIVPSLIKMLERDDLPTATIAKAYLVLKAKAGPSLALPANKIGKRIVEAVEKGQLKIASPADQLVLFEFLESEGPTPFALKQVGAQLQSSNKELRLAAHTLARRFGDKADALSDPLWPGVLNAKTKFDDALESLSTIARVEKTSKKERWAQLLKHDNPLIRMEAVRWWRRFDKQPDFIGVLNDQAVELAEKDPSIADEIHVVSRQLTGKMIGKETTKDYLAKYTVDELSKMTAGDRSKRAAMGLQVFERNACTKCHTTATATTLLAPSLKGVAQQKVDYLIESVLYPSKIIKTGWEVELIELTNGKVLTGLVKEEGKHLRVINLDREDRILKSEIETRKVSKTSVMPEGQHETLSRREFVDLIAYLQTLK